MLWSWFCFGGLPTGRPKAVAAMSDVVVQPSGIEGLGIFAARNLMAGERFREINVVREVTAASPLRPELGERSDHCDYPDGKVVLLGAPDRYVNHSCDPNSYMAYAGSAAWFVARRAIPRGAEITIDYNVNISGGTAWPCRCGVPRCTGTVVGDFFLLPVERQVEYRPLLAEWFVHRHRHRLAQDLDALARHSRDREAGQVREPRPNPPPGEPRA